MKTGKEITDLVRACEKLISMAQEKGSLTEDECGIASFYAKEVHDELKPYCARLTDQCDAITSS